MIIIQISDFHIGVDTNIINTKAKINKLIHYVNNCCEIDDEVVVLFCGDLFDKGEKKAKENVEHILSEIYNNVIKTKVNFEFIPGNHDLIEDNLDIFDEVIEPYLNEPKYKYSSKPIITRDYEGCQLVLASSINHRDSKYGLIDVSLLSEILEQSTKKVMIATHHSLINHYKEDSSSIRDSYQLIKLLSVNGILAFLHGHTHGYDDMLIGKSCKVIGTGPFLKQIPDVPSQFNHITVKHNCITSIDNIIYRADIDDYLATNCFVEKDPYVIQGSNLKNVYDDVVRMTLSNNCLYNLNIVVKNTMDNFFQEVESLFGSTIGFAEEWQMTNVPDTLYYNHGMYMDKDGNDSLSYITNELRKKATSSRCVIPLIDINDVVESGDSFLPSLDIIQFGFQNESRNELFVTIYLRALEVNHFLPINICEVYVMAKKIMEEITSIENISMNIFAFKVQYKKHFGCFRKALIDKTNPSEIGTLVAFKGKEFVIEAIRNKMELSETVIISDGMTHLCSAIEKQYELESESGWITKEVITNTHLVKTLYEELKAFRTKTSDYAIISKRENDLHNAINNLLSTLE